MVLQSLYGLAISVWSCDQCMVLQSLYGLAIIVQYNPDRTRCSGSTERMRVIGEARIKYPIFSGPTNFYVYGSIR